jgi:hypothetical protein
MIQELLEDLFKKTSKPQKEHKDRFYPTQSSVSVSHKSYKKVEGKCLRAAYYNCIAADSEDTFSLNKEIIFELGDYVEKMVLDKLDRKGVLVSRDTKFEISTYKISGKLDAIILDSNGKKVGVEIKSIGGNNKYATNAIYGSQWNLPEPKWQNLFQTLVYCYAFRDEIDRFILFYIRRDTGEIKEFEISILPKKGKLYPVIDGKIEERYTVNDILDRYTILNRYIEKKETPPREFQHTYKKELIDTYVKFGIMSKYQADKYKEIPFGDFECRFCSYSKRCLIDK